MNPENGKKTYESIDIPKNLNETVMQTIASKKKEELKMKYESNENKKASETKKSYRPVWRGLCCGGSSRSGRRHHRAEHKPRFCGKHEQGSRCGAAGAGADLPFL